MLWAPLHDLCHAAVEDGDKEDVARDKKWTGSIGYGRGLGLATCGRLRAATKPHPGAP
jgi:hypothetical protein